MSPDDGAPRDQSPSEPSAASNAPAPSLIARVKAAWANPAYRFVMLFLPYLAVVSIAYPAMLRYWGGFVQGFINATAWIEYSFFALFSESVFMQGKMVTFSGFAVTIVDECTGLYEMLIYSAAVSAFPTSWKKKGLGLLLGNPLIYFFNVVRIGMLIAVGAAYREWFEFMHVYFMQATMIVMITGVWLLWITQVVRDRDIARPDPAA